jgi:hypothetical protein
MAEQGSLFGGEVGARLFGAVTPIAKPDSGAAFGSERGDDGEPIFRYRLWRRWGPGRVALFVMVNPSTADAAANDPTIRRCVGYAKTWGFDGIDVVNLCAYRSTKKKQLLAVADPIGPKNDEHIIAAALDARVARIVCAWGEDVVPGRAAHVVSLLQRTQGALGAAPILCLGVNKDGQPKHPLRLRKDLVPEPFPRISP